MATNAKNTHIFAEDMTDDMCQEAIKISQDAFNLSISKGKVYSTIAANIRAGFDKSPNGPGWNCVVGRSFGAFVTHEIKTYMYFTVVPGVFILLWKA
ncbi:hypothetical protein ScalyP_jg8831 [Parmales sp. scaly parma]|nr:hypothetical protein ScalyP_jg8831 [Parmales sp. scaly parma]